MEVTGAWSQQALYELAKRIILSTQSEPYINDTHITTVSAHSSYKSTTLLSETKDAIIEYADNLFAKAGKLTAELTNSIPTAEEAYENILYYYSISEDGKPPFRMYMKISDTIVDLGSTEVTLTEIVDNLITEDDEKALSANMGYVLDQKKFDVFQGEENADKVVKVGEDGNLTIAEVEALPQPEDADKLLLTYEDETGNLDWKQVDKKEVGDVIPTYTQTEWDNLSEDEKPEVGSKVIIKDDYIESDGDIYSTNEIVVGRWIDGKPIYRRVVKGLTWENGTWNKNVFTKIDVSEIDSFISVKGISSLGRAIGMMQIDKNDGLLGSYSIDTNGTIIVEYTKV